MRLWASNAAAWKSLSLTPEQSARFLTLGENKDKGREQIFIHTGDFFSDAELTVPMPDMAPALQISGRVRPASAGLAAMAPPPRDRNVLAAMARKMCLVLIGLLLI